MDTDTPTPRYGYSHTYVHAPSSIPTSSASSGEVDYPKNKDGTVDARRREVRDLMSNAAGLAYRVNKDGSPDMRYTKNPVILQMKLDKLKFKK
jgi:hypothetical protein